MIERSTLSRTQLRVREREWVRLTFPTKLLKLLLSLNISNLLLALSSSKQRLIPLLSSSIEAIVFFIVLWSYSARSASSISGAWPRVSGPGFLCIISSILIRMFWLLVGGPGLVCRASRLRAEWLHIASLQPFHCHCHPGHWQSREWPHSVSWPLVTVNTGERVQTLPFNFFHWKLATITPCRLPAIAQRFPDMVFDGLPKVAIKRTRVEKFSWKEKGKEIYYDSWAS